MAESVRAKAKLRFSVWKPQPLHLVDVDRDFQVPLGCACCGAVATKSQREARGGREVLVPYCTECSDALLRHGTVQIASTLAAVVLVVSVLLTLPRLMPTLGVWGYAAIALFVGGAPPIVAILVRVRSANLPVRERAVWWWSGTVLACTQQTWAEQLANTNERPHTMALGRVPRHSALMGSGVVLALVLAPTLFTFLHPMTLVLNLASDDLELLVDGRPLGHVPVTSLESPYAGLRVRVGVGSRSLQVRDAQGRILVTSAAQLEAGKTYLFAPLADAYCFWIERDHYGRSAQAGGPEREYERLPQGRDLWELPGPIDSWFSKNPEAPQDRRSTGGTMTALRQARCTETPQEVAP
ncbi:MAG: hypothetical protein RJA70_2131 [Pseudomonadota bacterium]|jgi:hypothetical protein